MKGMAGAKEFSTPPPARYKVRITAVEATASKASGTSMLKLSGEVIEPAEHAGAVFFDNILTDGSAKGAGFSKGKLRGLGIDVDSDVEVSDDDLATQLTGIEIWADLDNQPRSKLNPATGKYDLPVTQVVDGKQVPVMNLVVSSYLGSFNGTPANTAETKPAETPKAAEVKPAPDQAASATAAGAKAEPPWKKKAAAAATK